MSHSSIREYLQIQQSRYSRRPGREARHVLLDECVSVTGLGRKHVIKVLGGCLPVAGQAASGAVLRRGRPPVYEALLPLIKALWQASEQPCGKRLRPILRDWLPYREKAYRAIPAAHRLLLKKVSVAQFDRLFAPSRASAGGRRRGRGGDGTLKAQIPLRTGPWAVSGLGWTEIDSVAHCGGSLSGSFWWTIVLTDICTGWTQQQPAWNKGQHATAAALETMENGLPFPLPGVDSDNGPGPERSGDRQPAGCPKGEQSESIPQLASAHPLARPGARHRRHPLPSVSQKRQRPHRAEKPHPRP